MKSTMIFAIVAGFAMLGAVGIGALSMAQSAAAVPSENCVATIKAAIADKRVTADERAAIKAACGSAGNEDCRAAIQTAIADKRVTKVEAQAIRDACINSQA
jgi:hypothetical protein